MQLATCPPTGQEGDGQHHGDYHQVLENQDGQAQAPGQALQSGLILQELEYDSRTAEGHQEADEQGHVPRDTALPGQKRGQGGGPAHLQQASGQDIAPDPKQLLGAELQADGKQQKNHPHLGHELHFMHVGDKPKAVGPGQGPGEKKAHDRRDAQAVE